MKFTDPTIQKRLEATVVLVCSLYLYHYFGFSWLFFVLTFALPDLSILGYLRGKSFGAFTYNLVHCFIWPTLLLVAGLTLEIPNGATDWPGMAGSLCIRSHDRLGAEIRKTASVIPIWERIKLPIDTPLLK